jgi:hypothetical protein
LLDVPVLTFDAQQYRSEVARATAERWWETPELEVVRLLEEQLRRRGHVLAELGLMLRFVGRRKHGYWIVLSDGAGQELIIELADQLGDPDEQASALAAAVLDSSPLSWPVVFCNVCDQRPKDATAEELAWLARARPGHPQHGRNGT